MKVLLLVFHPDLSKSRVNKIWLQQLETSGKVATVKDMYQQNPNFQFDIKKEQKDLVEHNKILLQFPMYWYMCTPLLKKWLDDVLEYGFAYGSDNQLKGKDLQLIISVGGTRDLYKTDSILELVKPFQKISNYLEMNFMIPFWQYEVGNATEDIISNYGKEWCRRIDNNKPLQPNSHIDWITEDGYPKMLNYLTKISK